MLKKILILLISVIISLSAINLVLAGNPFNPNDAFIDPDGDGLNNQEEYMAGSDPYNADSDNDGIDDYWEVENLMNPVDPRDAHKDFDYIVNDSIICNGEIDSEFSEINYYFNVWPSDEKTVFGTDKHYDNYEEYYRMSDVKLADGEWIVVEPYIARTGANEPDYDGDNILDPDDRAPTTFGTAGSILPSKTGHSLPNTPANNQKLQSIDTIESIHYQTSILINKPIFEII